MFCIRILFVWVGLLLSGTAFAGAPEVTLERTESEFRLDGMADEPAWQTAGLLEGFTVFEPNTGIKQLFDASARILIGADALYFFVNVESPGVEVFAPLANRDNAPGDLVSIRLDPFGTGRRGYEFIVNAAGVLADSRIRAGGDNDYAWDSLFDAEVSVREGGWSAEIRIPFQSLRFDPKETVWLAHIYANSWAHQQAISWAPIDRDQNNWMAQGGRLLGFGGQEPGRDFEVLPTLTSSWAQDEGETPSCDYGADVGNVELCGAQLEYGVGLKWGITSSMTFDAVFNPDFSQVEADPGILDLNSRFSIRLDERRPFFLEGADIFDTDFEVFYSRTIVQPEAALKLTGKAGGLRIGLLSAVDPLEDGGYGITEVARIQADVAQEATLGFLLVQRDDVVDGAHALSNTVFGVDGQANLTKQLSLEGEGFVSGRSVNEGNSNHRDLDFAGKLKGVWKTDSYRIQARYRGVGETFQSDAGFIPRTGYHEGFMKLDGYYRSDNNWARMVSPGLWVRYNVGQSGELEDRVVGMNTYWRFGHRVWSFVKFEHNGELVEHIEDDEVVGTTWMEASDFGWFVGSSTLRWLSIKGGVNMGQTPIRDSDLWDIAGKAEPFLGWYYSPSAEITVRPTSFMRLEIDYKHSMFLDGPSGLLLGEQPRLRGEFQVFLNRDFNLRHISQWTRYNEQLTNDSLISYTPMPGTVVFAGYRQTDSLDGSEPVERSVFFKASLLLDF